MDHLKMTLDEGPKLVEVHRNRKKAGAVGLQGKRERR